MKDYSGFTIIEQKNTINGNLLFESDFSDYELYSILDNNGFVPSDKNLKILKEGLKTGKYYIEDNIDAALFEEFKQYLNENPVILTEDILNEGKILNKLRWKLALFSLRLLSNKSLDAFLTAYYADKEGKPTKNQKNGALKKEKKKLIE